MYAIKYRRSVAKDLRRLPKNLLPAGVKRIQKLAKNPMPAGASKLRGTDNMYRVRQGDYRIVYSIENRQLIIIIVRVAHRKDAYKNW
jgi:mRNA interferase RelE/StbE